MRAVLATMVVLAMFPPCRAAMAGERHRPAAEVVVVLNAEGAPLVGIGEPPSTGEIAALVFVAPAEGGGAATTGRAVETALALAGAIGGSPPVRIFVSPDGTPGAAEALSEVLADAGLAPVVVHGEDGDATRQMTADAGGFHPRGEPGRPVPDAATAVAAWRRVASYGYGHTPPAFEPDGAGGRKQLRVPGWDEPTAGYACPFPALLANPAPAGLSVELGVDGGRTVPEEALASWCDAAAGALIRACAPDDLEATFADGAHAILDFGDPPGPGLHWLRPDRVVPPGDLSADPCMATALAPLEVAADHAGLTLHLRLTDEDIESGCRRERMETCRE